MLSPGNKQYFPPLADEIEVSIFGPGFGECIAVHLGLGEWLVVDSCIEQESKRPVALEYLETIGVNPATGIRVVVASHWDDDHIKGLSEVFQEATAATFVCSAAMTSPQFSSMLAAWRLRSFLPGGSGIDEMDAIIQELRDRVGLSGTKPPMRASAQKILWERDQPKPAEIRALSPSDAADAVMIARFAEIRTTAMGLSRRLPQITNNHASVVLSVICDTARVLLGADLQIRSDRRFGWFAIIDGAIRGERYEVYKIPHHGSSNADHDEIWSKLLKPEPIAGVTPFVWGGITLPTQEDRRRILSHTPNAYLTAPAKWGRLRDRDPRAEKLLRRFTKQVQLTPARFGHIRLRKNIGPGTSRNWEVAIFGAATKLTLN